HAGRLPRQWRDASRVPDYDRAFVRLAGIRLHNHRLEFSLAGEIVDPVEMLRRLVAFDTTSRNSNLALIDYVQAYLKGHGIESKLVPSEDGKKANMFATVGPRGGGVVLRAGPPDVGRVAAQPWDTDPWTLTLKSD